MRFPRMRAARATTAAVVAIPLALGGLTSQSHAQDASPSRRYVRSRLFRTRSEG